VEVASVLLKWWADVSAIDSLGQTPLHTAALRGHQRLARVLLDAGAVLASADLQGGGHTEVAKLLIAGGARVSTRCNIPGDGYFRDQQTLLHLAA